MSVDLRHGMAGVDNADSDAEYLRWLSRGLWWEPEGDEPLELTDESREWIGRRLSSIALRIEVAVRHGFEIGATDA